MNKANECTCPSGDGSLRWPCPKHPAVEQADVADKLTFINGRPAMCGCQVEYSDGGGEYSDVIYVTLCAKHSGSAILDLVATNRIALTPEYEGQWHADLYLDREIPLAKVEGATPAEAVLALMSAERIDPEQESVEQAGGDERAAFEAWWQSAEVLKCKRDVAMEAWQARAALAQPSQAQAEQATADDYEEVLADHRRLVRELDVLLNGEEGAAKQASLCDLVGQVSAIVRERRVPLLSRSQAEDAPVIGCLCGMPMTEGHHSPEGCTSLEEFAPQAQAEQAEAERPEVVAWRYGSSGGIVSDKACLDEWKSGGEYQSLMTVAQHERIVGELRAENERLANDRDRANQFANGAALEINAALARVAELEHVLRVVVNAADHGSWPTTVMHGIEKVREVLAGSAPPAKAQHSVPEGWKLVPSDKGCVTSSMKAECIGEFSFYIRAACAECLDVGTDSDCHVCGGDIEYDQKIDVPWDTCKEIYKTMLAAAPGKEGL
ncbi:hypothetical protein NPI31_003621 [Pseudomonas aeruginosa]|nr:hypothetical protein [Pseudomonas aeruginosa]ELJ3070347.1 hypothetical protein [Pseudomonas aeruginosa]